MSDNKPKFDIERYGKDPALRLSSGHIAHLPKNIDPVEVTLPGNYLELPGGVVTLYDPASLTGMFYDSNNGRWTMFQPVTRAEFEASVAAGVGIVLQPESGTAQ